MSITDSGMACPLQKRLGVKIVKKLIKQGGFISTKINHNTTVNTHKKNVKKVTISVLSNKTI